MIKDKNFSTRTIVEDLLVSGLADWADASWAVSVVASAGIEDEDVDSLRAGVFGLMAEVLFQGLMVPGDIVDDAHVPWSCPPAEALQRIVEEWISEWGYEFPTPGAIVWFANTPQGNEIAEAVLARESKSD